jgi:ribosomal protein S18 acetylase RimI-like enzyme
MRPEPISEKVVPLPPADDRRAIAVLAEAFADYPALRFVIGPAGDAFPERLAALLGFFVAARRARGEPVLGVRSGEDWAAVALATLPDAVAPPGSLDAARERTWGLLGRDARARYEELGERWGSLAVAEPHVHLNLVGVRAAERGRGLGAALVRAVVERSRAHPTSRGVSLSTETESNVGFYRALGFEVRGAIEVEPDVRSWVMVRPD